MERRFYLTMALLAGAMWIGGCGSIGESCTEIGCGSGVTTTIGKPQVTFASGLPLAARVCIDDSACTDLTIDVPAGAQPTCEAAQTGIFASCSVAQDGTIQVEQMLNDLANPTGSHEVHVTIRDAQDMVVIDETRPVSITASQPNGENCEPTCYQGTATL
jgi:hypothetical protein